MSTLHMSPRLTELTPFEQRVVDSAKRGEWVGEVGSRVEVLAFESDPGLCVRAELIRDLLIGCYGELDPRGVCLRGVRVIGVLDLDLASAVTGLKLWHCAIPDGITCIRAKLRSVNLNMSLLSYLRADGLSTDGSLFLSDATVRGAGRFGAVHLGRANISGQPNFAWATITNDTGTALSAEGLCTDGSLLLRDAIFRGAGEVGAVRLLGARIGGQLAFHRAAIINRSGPALFADRLRVDSHLFLCDAILRGAGESGAVQLLGAHIGAQLNIDRAVITNVSGPALSADRISIDDHMFLREATLRGAGKKGVVRLLGAHIKGQANFQGSTADNGSGPLVFLNEMKIEQTLFLSASLICPEGREEVGHRGCRDGTRHISMRGLVATHLSAVSWRQWLHLILHHTSQYRPQPFQHLAAVERTAGHDNNARQVLIAQQEDLRRRAPEALGWWVARWRHWLWGCLGRYGYRAHRLVATLVVVLAVAGGVAYAAGQVSTRAGHHAAERVLPAASLPDSPAVSCSTAELVGLGIDRGLPLGATGMRARCDLDTATRRGQAFTYALWALQALLWALATLTIAAYTGLVRKTA